MRVWAALVVALLGCTGSPTQRTISDPPDGPGAGEPECRVDRDCVAAGSKCCDCPTFSVPRLDAIHQACVDVICPDAMCPDSAQAVCDTGRCVLACVAMVCPETCANGFATDDNGCLTCSCAAPIVDGCGDVTDCVRVRADCCGCAHGGHDTAVLRRDAAAYEASLRCGAMPQCPAVTGSCDEDTSLECLQGRCALTTVGTLPPHACGRPDLAPCPPGQVCVINGADKPTTEQGVGLCQPPTS